jgi:hypothetical protein
MRVRPFFWAFLVIICTSLLVFAGMVAKNQEYPLQVQFEQVFTGPAGVVVVYFQVTDTENQPVGQATILLRASMPEMSMGPQVASLQTLGQGSYLARFSLSMAGLWQLAFAISAPGFLPAHPLIVLQMEVLNNRTLPFTDSPPGYRAEPILQ